MNQLATNYQHTRDQITRAANACHRNPTDIQLLAVSKTFPAEDVRTLYNLGQRAFGENYLQDAMTKIEALRKLDIEWHFIGPLQSNKTRDVAENFHWLQTLDRDKIAHRLNEQRPESIAPLNVCIQINVSREAQKAGIAPDELEAFANQLANYPKLKLRGLMAIPEATDDALLLQNQFREMQHLFQSLQQKHANIDTLSMGMTHDLELAIACGSTMVRIGTAIFGARQKTTQES